MICIFLVGILPTTYDNRSVGQISVLVPSTAGGGDTNHCVSSRYVSAVIAELSNEMIDN